MKECWINVYKSEYGIWYGNPRHTLYLAQIVGNKKYLLYRIHVKLK